MIRLLPIALFLLLSSSGYKQKSLGVAIDGLEKVQLVLRDPLMGTTIETYDLANDKIPAFVNDLNKAEHNPKLRMTTTCYEFVLKYPKAEKKKRSLSTNGRGIGPTSMGSFMTSENLVVKYWDITKEQLCKPKDPSKKRDVGF